MLKKKKKKKKLFSNFQEFSLNKYRCFSSFKTFLHHDQSFNKVLTSF